jgi:hypothetical protein
VVALEGLVCWLLASRCCDLTGVVAVVAPPAVVAAAASLACAERAY